MAFEQPNLARIGSPPTRRRGDDLVELRERSFGKTKNGSGKIRDGDQARDRYPALGDHQADACSRDLAHELETFGLEFPCTNFGVSS